MAYWLLKTEPDNYKELMGSAKPPKMYPTQKDTFVLSYGGCSATLGDKSPRDTILTVYLQRTFMLNKLV